MQEIIEFQTFSLTPLGLSKMTSTSPLPALNVSTINLAGAPTEFPVASIPKTNISSNLNVKHIS